MALIDSDGEFGGIDFPAVMGRLVPNGNREKKLVFF